VKDNYISNAAHTEFLGSDYFDQLVTRHGDEQVREKLWMKEREGGK
jgi:hypothetical protein